MKYYRIKPSESLAGYVKYFWIGEADASPGDPFIHFSTATSSSRIVFHYKGKFEEVAPDGRLQAAFSSGIQGQSGTYTQFRSCENVGIFGIEFFPYAIPSLFSIPAPELTGRFVDLNTLVGYRGRELEERIFSASTDREKVMIAMKFLESSIKAPKSVYIMNAIRQINLSKGQVNIDHLARQFPVSQRQFGRLFKEACGLTPKLYARILKFEAALDTYETTRSFTELALACGYFDQSHFNRDFREFTGFCPKNYFNNAGNPAVTNDECRKFTIFEQAP